MEKDSEMTRRIALDLDRYRSGALTRGEFLETVGRLVGGVAAASMLLPILESKSTAVAAEQALALSLQEMSDRLEIQRNVWDYANAIDLQAWDLLDEVLAPDAELFYGRVTLKGAAIKPWLRELLTRPELRGYCHMMLDPRITIRGDRAESLTRCLNPMEVTLAEQQRQVRYHFLWYQFEHVRWEGGWRIRQRLADASRPRDLHWQTPPFNAARAAPPLPYRES